jgi:uncharacterized protein YqeY
MSQAASPLKTEILDHIKAAMRAKEKDRLNTLRLVSAAIKQQEVDNREDLDDAAVLATLTKMCKQRRDSIEQFEAAGRDDLSAIEIAELAIIAEFMPEAMSDNDIDAAIKAAIAESGASSMRDMGSVMNILRPQLQGRADMGAVSGRIKAALNA